MITFPRGTGPAIVDWVDYAETVGAASPAAFADDAGAEGGRATTPIWLVWQPGYQTFGIKCEQIASTSARWPPRRWRWAQRRDGNQPALYYEPMNLTEFAFSGS